VIYLGDDENTVSTFRRAIDRFLRKPVTPETVLQGIVEGKIPHDDRKKSEGHNKEEPDTGDTADASLTKTEKENIPPLGDPKVSAELMKRWTGAYRVVVFDMPPVWDPGFSARLASQVDGVILVVEAEKVRWEVARQAIDLLGQSKANVIGAVLNKRQFHIPEWMYKRL